MVITLHGDSDHPEPSQPDDFSANQQNETSAIEVSDPSRARKGSEYR